MTENVPYGEKSDLIEAVCLDAKFRLGKLQSFGKGDTMRDCSQSGLTNYKAVAIARPVRFELTARC